MVGGGGGGGGRAGLKAPPFPPVFSSSVYKLWSPFPLANFIISMHKWLGLGSRYLPVSG